MPGAQRPPPRTGLERRYAVAVAGYFRGMLSRIEPGIRTVLERRVETKADTPVTVDLSTIAWDQETRILSTAVRPVAVLVGDEAAAAVGTELGITGSLDLAAAPVTIAQIGSRIRQVTDVSRARIGSSIADGIAKGLSVEQIVRGVRPGTTNVRGPVPAFQGIAGLVDSWSSTGTPGFAGATGTVPLRSSRAYLIALTETGTAYNSAAIDGYASSGLVDFVEVFDGPDCGWMTHDDPDLAHASIRTLAEAKAHPLAHPRCQRAFGASLAATGAKPSPFQGRPPTNVPGATPGLRPDDTQPFSGRLVPTGPPAVSPFFGRPAGPLGGEAARIAELERVADRIRSTATHETAVVVEDTGKIVLEKTDPTKPREVNFTPAEISQMRGSTLTHNHPLAYQHDLLHATSFSPDDINLFFHAGMREVRAVGKGADYVFSADPALEQAVKDAATIANRDVRAAAQAAIDDGLRIGREEISARPGHFDMRAYGELQRKLTEEAERLHWHRVWTSVAKRVPGVRYQQTLRPGVG